MYNLPPVHGYGTPQILSQWQAGQDRRENTRRYDAQMDWQQEGRDESTRRYEEESEAKTQAFELEQEKFAETNAHNEVIRKSAAFDNNMKLWDTGLKQMESGNKDLGLTMLKEFERRHNSANPNAKIDISSYTTKQELIDEMKKTSSSNVNTAYKKAMLEPSKLNVADFNLSKKEYEKYHGKGSLDLSVKVQETGTMTDQAKSDALDKRAGWKPQTQEEALQYKSAGQTGKTPEQTTHIKNYEKWEAMPKGINKDAFGRMIGVNKKTGEYAPDPLTKLFDKLDSLPEGDERREAYQKRIDTITTGGDPVLERMIAQLVVDEKLDFNKLSRRGKQKGRIAVHVTEIDPNFNLIDADANIKYKTDSANLRSIALIAGIKPLYDNLSGQAAGLNNSIFPIFNKGMNFYKLQTGEKKIVAFNNMRDDVIAETERVLLGTGVLSDSKYTRALGNLNTSQSPQQMAAAIEQMVLVVSKREEALREQPYPQKKDEPEGADWDNFWEE